VSDIGRRPVTPRSRRLAVDAAQARALLDQERQMVGEAILLVSRGGSRRVTLAGLRNAAHVLDASQSLAATRGVRLVALPTDDARAVDVAVEAIASAAAVTDRIEPVAARRPLASVRAAAHGGA
jgi:hypothetical protein